MSYNICKKIVTLKILILDKSFIHCPAEDKAEATIFGFKPQDEYKPGLAERDN